MRNNIHRRHNEHRNSSNNNNKEPTEQNDDVESEIEQIQTEIDRLQQRLDRLRLRRSNRTRENARNRTEREITIGTRVRVLNYHRGLRGTVGIVISTSSAQVTIQPESGDNAFRRFKQNVEVVEDE